MTPEPLIAVQDLTKRYGRKPVLRGVNLTVAPGQIVALLGPNGAGKSTLMRILSGLTKADRGEIRLGGVSYLQAGHELRRYVGLVSHAPLLYDNLTALENLRFFAALYDLDAGQDAQAVAARIEWVLTAVGLWNRRRDPVRSYSRGMAQRLAIARAILHNPPVLLLDEPDTGLDPSGAALLHELLHALGGSNRAILFSTHHMERALEWSDSISLLQNGKIAFAAACADLDLTRLQEAYAEHAHA